jgi:hypothetical protein
MTRSRTWTRNCARAISSKTRNSAWSCVIPAASASRST